jgi:hypothetical protein
MAALGVVTVCAVLAVLLAGTAAADSTPVVALGALGPGPLVTATPTLRGTASVGPGDGAAVTVGVFSGPAATGAPVRLLTGTLGAGGSFAVSVEPALADGTYTAVAEQQGLAADGYSAPETFAVRVHPPALTLVLPGNGVNVSVGSLQFSGADGATPLDVPIVSVALYRGPVAAGRPIGVVSVRTTGPAWSLRWPVSLPLGFYTVLAGQRDSAGHTAITPPHTFLLIPRLRAARTLRGSA